MGIYTLCKAERLNSKILIGKMFEGGISKSFSIFPIRVVYMPVEQGEASASILISVSKRRFKRAVKRNRVKRQIREAYRKNKSILLECLQGREQHLAIAFIYLSDELTATAELEEKMKIALSRISENCPHEISWFPNICQLDIRKRYAAESVFILAAYSYLFLSGLYFTVNSSFLSVHTVLFGLCS